MNLGQRKKDDWTNPIGYIQYTLDSQKMEDEERKPQPRTGIET